MLTSFFRKKTTKEKKSLFLLYLPLLPTFTASAAVAAASVPHVAA